MEADQVEATRRTTTILVSRPADKPANQELKPSTISDPASPKREIKRTDVPPLTTKSSSTTRTENVRMPKPQLTRNEKSVDVSETEKSEVSTRTSGHSTASVEPTTAASSPARARRSDSHASPVALFTRAIHSVKAADAPSPLSEEPVITSEEADCSEPMDVYKEPFKRFFSINTIKADLESWVSLQWPFTCYAPAGYQPNVVEDVDWSPDEARWSYYHALDNPSVPATYAMDDYADSFDKELQRIEDAYDNAVDQVADIFSIAQRRFLPEPLRVIEATSDDRGRDGLFGLLRKNTMMTHPCPTTSAFYGLVNPILHKLDIEQASNQLAHTQKTVDAAISQVVCAHNLPAADLVPKPADDGATGPSILVLDVPCFLTVCPSWLVQGSCNDLLGDCDFTHPDSQCGVAYWTPSHDKRKRRLDAIQRAQIAAEERAKFLGNVEKVEFVVTTRQVSNVHPQTTVRNGQQGEAEVRPAVSAVEDLCSLLKKF